MARNSERLYVARSGSSATNTTAVAMVAATAKTVVQVIGSSTDTIVPVRFKISFDGVTTTAVPPVIELGIITAAGTNTAFTPVQMSGSPLASSATAGYNSSAEPTYNRIFDSFYFPALMGTYEGWFPLGDEPLCAISQGVGIRITAAAVVNCLASITYSE